MNTQKMFDIALKVAGLDKPTEDAAVIVPGENIKKVLVGIDMNTQELVLAKMLGYDCVVGHHPRNVEKNMTNVFRNQMYTMHKAGIPLNEAQKLIEKEAAKMDEARHAVNFNRNASAAEILHMPFMCIHTPADLIVESSLQKICDERFGNNPMTKLGDVLKIFDDIPEFQKAIYPPKIDIGSPDSYAGRIMVIMAGLTEPGPDVFKAYARAGVGTFVFMHCSEESLKAIREQGIANVINAGHMACDSYGMNRILDAWEKEGLKITAMSGLLR